ncbi:MAG: glycosyltransferase family 39 protein [Chloroflexota bacterium]
MLGRREIWVGLCFCLLLATGLRTYQLEALPPGVHFDEAANGLLAGEIAFNGERPLFITSYTGKEVLFFYAAAGVMRLIEPSVFGLRLTAVYLGLLTIAATYWLGVELFRGRRVALFAAGLLAISFWHLLFSRLGFRAISQPLLQAIMVAAWLRGLRLKQDRWFIFSGICLGLLGYTYLAARLFPIVIVLAALPLLWIRPFPRQLMLKHFLLLLCALVVIAPLLIFFVQNPDAFWVRITQVSPGDSDQLTLQQSLRLSLKMFFLSGDPYIRFNLPQRPIFNAGLGVLMVLGFLFSAFKLWRTRLPRERTAVLLLLLTPFVMILPTAIATNEIVPSNLRAIGLIPFLFYLPAMGLDWFLRRRWLFFLQKPTVVFALFGIGAVGLGAETALAYFQTWGEQTALFLETDGDLADVALQLDQLDLSDETLFVASPHYQHPTVALLSERYGQINWLPAGEALVFPAQSNGIVLFPAKTPPAEWMTPYLETAVALTPAINNIDNFVAAYQFETVPELDIPVQQGTNFSNIITLLGYGLDDSTEHEVNLSLFWSVEGLPSTELIPFVHLEDMNGYRWSQVEPFAYPSSQWARGDLIIQQVNLPIPVGTPPGQYQLKLGLFDPGSGNRLAQFDENGRYAGDAFTIESVPLVAQTSSITASTPPLAINREISHGLVLVGHEVIQPTIFTGEQLPVSLHWFAPDTVPPITLRFSLLKVNEVGGRILANNQPVYDTYPFQFWETPQYVIDRQRLSIPEDTEPGQYIVNVRLLDALEKTIGVFELGEVTVEKTDRVFAQPDFATAQTAVFGSEIMLHGYSLLPLGDTDFELTLIWQALQNPKADYTVFVHLLTPEGGCDPCIWQQDVMPQQNQYPTTRWLTNEYVIDRYRIELPEGLENGRYPIEIGLYLADSGIRLQIESEFVNTGDALFLEPIVRE